MNNIDGALAFKATLDIDDFNVSAKAMERNIRNVSSTAVAESAKMDNSIQSFAMNGARYIVSYLVGQGMTSLVNSIVQTRGQFQQLEIAFSTMLKSSSQAKKLMDELVVTAAKTPFDLQGIAGTAKQLMAYGATANSVVDELVMLGNVASGVGAPLSEIAYLYGTLRTQGRAMTVDIRQFAGRGIPIYEELAKVLGVTKKEVSGLVTEGKVGFAEVEKAFKNMTSSAGIYNNLMEEQSKSLTGMISNLGDAWDSVLNDFGKANQDLFGDAIQGAIYFVEHMDDVLRIVKAIAVGYGSMKAAIALNTLATKGYTGVALLDNTVRQAKLSILKAEAVATGQVAAQTKAMVSAQASHVASLKAQLTAEENANVIKKLRIATIQQMLTAQQQEYLSNLNLTASNANYEAVAMGVLSVEQKQALSKLDLTAKGAAYRAILEKEVQEKKKSIEASIAELQVRKKEALEAVESNRMRLITAKQNVANAQMELAMARQTGDATKIATAQKKVEVAVDAEVVAQKRLLAAQSVSVARGKQLEVAATKQSTLAGKADIVTKGAQTTATGILTLATGKLKLAFTSLWVAMKSNPIGWLLTAFGLLFSYFTSFVDSEEEATNATDEYNKSTEKEISNLRMLMSMLENTKAGTQAHKEVLEKINAICRDYNKTLLGENATLEEQTKKYNELSEAIRNATKEKVNAKYIEEYTNKKNSSNDKTFSEFKEQAESLKAYHAIPGANGYYASATNINKMTGNMYDLIRSDAERLAEDLKGLAGHEYAVEFNKSVAEISQKVQAATEASEAEMTAFEKIFAKALREAVEHAREYSESVERLVDTSDKYNGKEVTESVDFATMSFEELDKKIKDTQKSIDELNGKKVKVDSDQVQLKELKDLLDKLNNTVDKKEAGLNTEKGISDRIKQLKEEREITEINSARYKQLTNDITNLEKRLPKHKGDNASEQLREKQLEADRKLEADRIAVMEEGYEKRSALLSLQHKKTLDAIDKEEKALEKARKDSGNGGLSRSEKDGFNERRNLENKSYEKQQTKLFDGELDYKKKQYELYFRWVSNMGEDVANKQFSSLLKGGASYKEYLESQIQQLKSKKDNGTLSEGEGNHLISLNMQYNEITGAKSAMDAFKDSVTKSISQAQTLAEKMEALADAKERLSNGGSGIVGVDDKSAASLFVSKEEAKLQEELQNTLITKFRTYEEEKLSIQNQYALLRKEAEKQGNQERINQVNQAELEALSSLNAKMLMQTDSWKKLFGDLDSLSVAEIEKLIADIEGKLANSNLKLNPVDYKAVIDSLNKAKQELVSKNPFKALGTFFDDYIKAKQKLATAKANVLSGKGTDKDVQQAESEMKKAGKGVTESIVTITDVATECGNSIASMFSDLGDDKLASTLGTAMDLMGQLGNAAASVGKFMSGDILAGVTGMVSSISSVVGIFAKLHDAKYERRIQNLQKDIDNLEQSYNRLERAFNNTYWVFSDGQREAYEKNVQLIKDQISALEQEALVAKRNWDFRKFARLNKEIKDLNAQLKKAEESGDMYTIFEAQKANLEKQKADMMEQIRAEQDKKKTDQGKIEQWQQQIESINQKIEDLDRAMMETLAGTDVKSAIDEFAEALVDAYCKGEDAAEALGQKTKDVLKKAVVEALKRQFLAKGINDAVMYLGEAMKDNILSKTEKEKFEQMVNSAGDIFNKALSGIGDWIKDVEEVEPDPLKGAVTSMSEETGGVIAGRLNAFIINQSDQTVIMRRSLEYHAQIAANTKESAIELKEIKSTLKRIESNGGNSLLSQGIS